MKRCNTCGHTWLGPLDDGGPVTSADIAVLVAAIQNGEHRAVVNGWLVQARDAGCSWDPRLTLRERQYEITRAALALAKATSGDDDFARLLLAAAMESPMVEAARIVVGEALSTLTIREAKRAVAVAEAFGYALLPIFAEDGTPLLSGDVGRVLEAAA